MDARNGNRITTAIDALTSITTKDEDAARWLIDVIEQLEEIVTIGDDVRIDVWRKRLGASNGRG